ncbi:MAG: HAD family hydrolase [Bacteroidota bacterium]
MTSLALRSDMNYQGHAINSIIFDLGDVIIDLDIPGTISRFADCSGKSVEEVRMICSTSPVFLDYEKGLITNTQFRAGANRLFNTSLSDDELDNIWNSMLLDVPAEKITMLEELARNHRLFLLSNTNDIHIRCFSGIFNKASGGRPIDDFFEKVYYSHQINMRKPNEEIFRFVLEQNRLDPSATLFLDDNADNIRGAAATGIHTFHVTHPSVVINVFK